MLNCSYLEHNRDSQIDIYMGQEEVQQKLQECKKNKSMYEEITKEWKKVDVKKAFSNIQNLGMVED